MNKKALLFWRAFLLGVGANEVVSRDGQPQHRWVWGWLNAVRGLFSMALIACVDRCRMTERAANTKAPHAVFGIACGLIEATARALVTAEMRAQTKGAVMA